MTTGTRHQRTAQITTDEAATILAELCTPDPPVYVDHGPFRYKTTSEGGLLARRIDGDRPNATVYRTVRVSR